MPHRIINKLNQLMELDIPSQLHTANPFLGNQASELPEHALGLIDDLIEDCCRIFGNRTPPTPAQRRIMAEAGYQVSFKGSLVDNTLWDATVIHTPKGLIQFK